jgi:tRNA-modifying protein YgfZ
LLLDTERVALQALFNMIRRFSLGYQVELHKRTLERGLLSLIGPRADELVRMRGQTPDSQEHANVRSELGLLIRTDAGIDVVCDSAETEHVKAALLDAGAVQADEAAADVLRVEHGRPRYGVDLDDSVIPQEAGLNERAVSFTKGCYVGQETVARLHYRGKPNRHLRGLRLARGADTGDELRLGERAVGRVGSAAVSPRLGPIALALVRREAAPGDKVSVGDRDNSAELVELPFAAG